MIPITPYNDCILVELKEAYTHIATTEKKYDTKTSGLCIAISHTLNDYEKLYTDLMDKLVYFDEYKDGTQIAYKGNKYALIDIKDVRGVQSNT